jgi:hypothetical protein
MLFVNRGAVLGWERNGAPGEKQREAWGKYECVSHGSSHTREAPYGKRAKKQRDANKYGDIRHRGTPTGNADCRQRELV